MRSLALVAFVGIVAVALAAALDDREVAYPTGVPAVRLAAALAPGERVCWPADAPAAFARVGLVTGTFGAPGPALDVRVAGRRGRIAAGYPDNATVAARVGPVGADGAVRVCVRNAGARRVALFGAPPAARPRQLADPARRPVPAAVFLRDEPASMLSLVPAALARAARFRPVWVGAWAPWVLLAAVAVGLPALLARALYASERSSSGASTSGDASS